MKPNKKQLTGYGCLLAGVFCLLNADRVNRFGLGWMRQGDWRQPP